MVYEPVHVRRHEQKMLAGHYGVGVTAKELEEREKVRERNASTSIERTNGVPGIRERFI